MTFTEHLKEHRGEGSSIFTVGLGQEERSPEVGTSPRPATLSVLLWCLGALPLLQKENTVLIYSQKIILMKM